MSTPKVEYAVGEGSRWEVHLELTTEVPDTNNPDFPGGGTVRPKFVNIGVVPDRETGLWGVWNASVVGPKIKDGKVSTKRDYAIPFMGPLDGEGGSEAAPQWLKDLCQEWTDRANGISTNSPARGEGPAVGLEQRVARAIKEAQETLEKDSRDLADRYEAWSHHPFDHSQASVESSRIASHAELLAQAAARLEGMREVARIFVTED